MTACNLLTEQLTDLTFPAREGGRQFQVGTEEALVDGSYFNAGVRAGNNPIGGAKTRHAGYHVRRAILRRGNRFVNSRTPIVRRRLRAPAASRIQARRRTDSRGCCAADS